MATTTTTYPTTCPECAADLTLTDAIRTDELTPGTCYAYVDAEADRLEFDGETRLAWDCQTTEAVYCDGCGHRLDGEDGDTVESLRARVAELTAQLDESDGRCCDHYDDAAVADELATGGRNVPPAWRAFQILRELDHEELLNAGAEGWADRAQGRDGALDVLDVSRSLIEGAIAIDSDDPRVLLAFHLLRDAGDDRGGQRPAEVPQPIRDEEAATLWQLYRSLTAAR